MTKSQFELANNLQTAHILITAIQKGAMNYCKESSIESTKRNEQSKSSVVCPSVTDLNNGDKNYKKALGFSDVLKL